MFLLDQNGKLIIDPNVLMVKPLKEIWEQDRTKTKEGAYSILSGIYFIGNPNSPYWSWEEKKKNKDIEDQYFKPYKLKDKIIQDALIQYREFININPSQILLEAAKETLYKLAAHLKGATITSGKDGNITQISSTMDKIAKTLASYDTLKQAVEKEKLGSAGKRGILEVGYDEE